MALPNGPMEIVFSFDTTVSMTRCLDEVRGRVSDMVQRLQADIPGIRIAIFVHGDYCDNVNYVTKFVDFTDDAANLCDFVKNVSSSIGGDADECYELALYEIRTKLSWKPGTQRALVMIGDANPHEPSYPDNKLKLDWRKEVEGLRDMGVRIYGVECFDRGARDFYKHISEASGGHHLKLNDFKQIFDFLMTVCYSEKGPELLNMYEKEVRARQGPIHTDLNKLFHNLQGKATSGTNAVAVSKATTAIVKPVPSKREVVPFKKRLDMYKKPQRKGKMSTLRGSFSAYKLENLPKLRREEVPEKTFLLNNMAWTKWQLAISPSVRNDCTVNRPGSNSGYRKKQVFPGNASPALYEISVQPVHRCRKYVVYSKVCQHGLGNGLNWERKLLGKKDIRKEIDSVVQRGCSIYVRRMILKDTKTTDKTKQSLKLYDYAWSVIRSQRESHRHVKKVNVTISEEQMEM